MVTRVKGILPVTAREGNQMKTWLWNEQIKKLVKEKRLKKWRKSGDSKSKELYLDKNYGTKGTGKKNRRTSMTNQEKQLRYCNVIQ